MSETPEKTNAIVAELEQKLLERDRALSELRRAAALHVMEAERMHGALRERDAYIEELESAAREQANLAEKLLAAQHERTATENELRQTRGRLAQAEGDLLRLGQANHSAGSVSPEPVAMAPAPSELAQEIEKLKRALEAANAENWKMMKARSDAEAQAAEVREDTVRKLRDARKIATVELTRAMEEATKKAVGLKEELARSEAERKKLVAEKKELLLAVESASKPTESAAMGGDMQVLQAERDDFELRYTLGIKTIQRLNAEIAHLRTRLQELVDTVDRSKTPASGNPTQIDLTRL